VTAWVSNWTSSPGAEVLVGPGVRCPERRPGCLTQCVAPIDLRLAVVPPAWSRCRRSRNVYRRWRDPDTAGVRPGRGGDGHRCRAGDAVLWRADDVRAPGRRESVNESGVIATICFWECAAARGVVRAHRIRPRSGSDRALWDDGNGHAVFQPADGQSASGTRRHTVARG
jgi:hypothetical protein